MKKGLSKKINMFLIAVLLLSMFNFNFIAAPKVFAADEYDSLRLKWKDVLTGGSTYNTADTDIANQITTITSNAQSVWDTMDKSPSRTYLWSDAASTTVSAQVGTNYKRLKDMALAYSTRGSTLLNNATLLTDIIGGLDWLYMNRYNESTVRYDNWWDWEIGNPKLLNDIIVLLYDQLTSTQITNYTNAIEFFCPDATKMLNGSSLTTGANLVDKVQIVAIRGIIVKNSTKIASARDALSPVFDYVTTSDGFYTDGSFIQHDSVAYTMSYGIVLLKGLANIIDLLSGSTWAVTNTGVNNMYAWIYSAYEPLIYNGQAMDMTRGRSVSRYSYTSHAAGHDVIEGLVKLAQFAPLSDAAAYKSMIKYWINADTERNFYSGRAITSIVLAKSIMDDTSVISRGELIKYKQYSNMDRTIHLRPGYGLGLSMYSSRVTNYEDMGSENRKGWYTGSGMTYLYNNDLLQYDDNFWPTVNPYRLPGTTVDTMTRLDGEGEQRSSKSWVGGTSILGTYGVSGMEAEGLMNIDGFKITSGTTPTSTTYLDNVIVTASGDIMISENFDSTATGSLPSGWVVLNGSDTLTSVAEIPSATDKSLKLYDANSKGATSAKKFFAPQTGIVTAEWKFMEPIAGQYATFSLLNGGVNATQLTTAGGGLKYYDSTNTAHLVQTLSSNTWFTVKVVANIAARTYDIYVDGTLKVSGAEFRNLGTSSNTLTAKKSWFMFDDEIVALGSGINSTDSRTIETIVDNKKINSTGNNAFSVNGTAKSTSLGWLETMSNVSWMHMAGNVTGSDIGYYFPGTATINGLREARTGRWYDINSSVSSTETTTNYTRNYLTTWFDHGSNPTNQTYSYVILPNKTSSEVSSYASNPNVTILENSTDAQAVKENNLNIIGANFWNDAIKSVDIITSNKKASVMTKETSTDIEVSVSDPTMVNTGSIDIEINKQGTSTVSSDPGVTVTQLSPTIKLTVNVNGAKGAAFKAKFSLPMVNENFNGYTTGSAPTGWTISSSPSTSTTVADIPSSSDKSLKLDDTNISGATSATKTFTSQAGFVTAEWKFMEPTAGKYPSFQLLNSSSLAAVQLFVNTAPNLVYRNAAGTDIVVQSGMVSGTWYTVKIVANNAAKTYDIYVNGTLKITGAPYRNNTDTSIDRIKFGTGTTPTGVLHIDNVIVK